jgi:hypothetical protein
MFRQEQFVRTAIGDVSPVHSGTILVFSSKSRSARTVIIMAYAVFPSVSKAKPPLAGPPQKQADMKKPTLRIEEQQPRNIQRADVAPENGYAMVVDGHFKTQFSEESAAKKAATALLSRYPMLQVEIYDAGAKTRMRVEQREALTTQ